MISESKAKSKLPDGIISELSERGVGQPKLLAYAFAEDEFCKLISRLRDIRGRIEELQKHYQDKRQDLNDKKQQSVEAEALFTSGDINESKLDSRLEAETEAKDEIRKVNRKIKAHEEAEKQQIEEIAGYLRDVRRRQLEKLKYRADKKIQKLTEDLTSVGQTMTSIRDIKNTVNAIADESPETAISETVSDRNPNLSGWFFYEPELDLDARQSWINNRMFRMLDRAGYEIPKESKKAIK